MPPAALPAGARLRNTAARISLVAGLLVAPASQPGAQELRDTPAVQPAAPALGALPERTRPSCSSA